MNDKHDYILEKLSVTVTIIAMHLGPLQERLRDAWMSQGHRLFPSDFSGELKVRFEEIVETLNSVKTPEGSLNATTAVMTDEVARSVAEKIVLLYDDVWRAKFDAKKS